MNRIVLDSKSNRYFDDNGYLVIKDNKIAKAGVFEYLGKEISDRLPESEIYKVYRSWEELEKTAKDFEGMPVKFGHEWVEPSKRDLKIGAVSGEVRKAEPYLIADIKIYDKGAIEGITNKGIVDLSPGYTAKYTAESGEYNGEKYEFTQSGIKYNHLAVVEDGRSGKEVRIQDNKTIKGVREMKDFKNGLRSLVYAKKTYDECITSKTDDVDKRELIREIVAIAVKPDTDFQGGEEEKFRTILKKAESLGYEPSETSKTDDAEQTADSDVVAMKEAFNSFASLFNDFLNEEEKEPAHTQDADGKEEMKEKEEEKQTGDRATVSKQVMDARIEQAIVNERKRTQDAISAYEDVRKHIGSFDMNGMSKEEIYQYAYEMLTGEKVKVGDAMPSWKAYMKAKVADNSYNQKIIDNDDLFTHIK